MDMVCGLSSFFNVTLISIRLKRSLILQVYCVPYENERMHIQHGYLGYTLNCYMVSLTKVYDIVKGSCNS